MNSKGAYALQRGHTYFKEGLHASKRAHTLLRGPTYFEDGLRKRALDVNVNRNEGLLTSTGAHILQRGLIM